MKIKRGDTVQIILGKDRGKTGKVERVFIKDNKILVAGANVYKRHVSGKRAGMDKEGGIIAIPKPMNLSNVMLVCPNCKKATKVGYKLISKDKVRICKKCGKEIIK